MKESNTDLGYLVEQLYNEVLEIARDPETPESVRVMAYKEVHSLLKTQQAGQPPQAVNIKKLEDLRLRAVKGGKA
jgi:hypothetical protein